MAILTPAQLQASNAATYTTNGVGNITGATARNFNIDFISSSIVASMTASMTVASASYAVTASHVLGTVASASYAVSASYSNNSTSASYANFSTSASYSNNSTSASYALNATSASYSNNSTSASYALNATTASYVSGAILNLTDTYTSTDKIDFIITLTAAQYSGIGSPLSNTLYVII